MAADETLLQAAHRVASAWVNHNAFQYADADAIESLPLTVVHEREDDEPEEHHNVYFDEPIDEVQVRRWIDALTDPVPKIRG